MTPISFVRLERSLLWIVIATLAVVAFQFREREQCLMTQLEIQSLSSMRAQVQDAMIGNPFPVDSFPTWAPTNDEGAIGGLVWVVRTEDCAGCLTGIADWNRIASSDLVPTLVILVGADVDEQALARRILSTSTEIVSLAPEPGRAMFGWMLPSTQLLLDGSGVIISADSRASGQECGWSFAAQVGVHLGLLDGSRIRQ
jgi:hypothetical protein